MRETSRKVYKARKAREYRANKTGQDGLPASSAYKAAETRAVKKFENGEVDKDFVPVENGEPPSAPEMMR